MKRSIKKKIMVILILSLVLSLVAFLMEYVLEGRQVIISRNAHGEGEKIVEYEFTVEGEPEKQSIQIEVEEQQYSEEEIQKMFREIQGKLEKVVLGENESFDRVEKNLNLVTQLENYPVQISWQLDSYKVLNLHGEIQEKNLVSEGTLVEIRGVISYGDKKCIYVQNARVYPLTRQGADKLLYDIKKETMKLEEDTRQKTNFKLPEEVDGKQVKWNLKKQNQWCYVIVVGITLCIYLVYREYEKVKRQQRQRQEEILRDYPGMISKFTMLLGTGATVRNAWEKIVKNYSVHKEQTGMHVLYEEMTATLHEIQGGIAEEEAYERFGKRCKVTVCIKFGTLLSQNLRKGSRGISEILRMEAIQSFENRKNRARRLGEEAGTKLMMPMFGMLAVVFIMVMIPAFLSIQI